jgi:hypothetical protein
LLGYDAHQLAEREKQHNRDDLPAQNDRIEIQRGFPAHASMIDDVHPGWRGTDTESTSGATAPWIATTTAESAHDIGHRDQQHTISLDRFAKDAFHSHGITRLRQQRTQIHSHTDLLSA